MPGYWSRFTQISGRAREFANPYRMDPCRTSERASSRGRFPCNPALVRFGLWLAAYICVKVSCEGQMNRALVLRIECPHEDEHR